MLRRRRFKYNLCLAKRLRICARNRGGFRLPIGETPCLNEHARTSRFAPGVVADISGFQTVQIAEEFQLHFARSRVSSPLAPRFAARMVGHAAIALQTAEPAVCQVEVDLFAQAPFRTDAEAIADQPHPDHQLGGDRGPPDSAVGGRQLRLQPSNSTNLSIDRNR